MVEVSVTLDGPLHARPAALVVSACGRYRSQIRLLAEGRAVDGRSILGLMSLGAPVGATVTVRAEGEDEAEAAAEIARVLRESCT